MKLYFNMIIGAENHKNINLFHRINNNIIKMSLNDNDLITEYKMWEKYIK